MLQTILIIHWGLHLLRKTCHLSSKLFILQQISLNISNLLQILKIKLKMCKVLFLIVLTHIYIYHTESIIFLIYFLILFFSNLKICFYVYKVIRCYWHLNCLFILNLSCIVLLRYTWHDNLYFIHLRSFYIYTSYFHFRLK